MARMTETRVRPSLAAALALATALLAVGGCDGGIFGTGDGSSNDVAIDAGPTAPSAVGPGGDSGAPPPETAGPEDGDATGDSADAGEMSPGAPLLPSNQPLANFVATDSTTSAPRLRIVNAGGSAVALASDAADPGEPLLPPVAPGTASAYATLADDVDGLMLGYVAAPGDTRLEDPQLLRPLTLVASSVTTLLVRDGQRPTPAIVALPTRIASDDPTLALVRLLPGSGGGPAASYTLVPDGDDPGGAEIALGDVALGGPVDAEYRPVPAGDYRLESSAPGVPPRALSFTGGAVRTLVLLGSGELLVVEDGG